MKLTWREYAYMHVLFYNVNDEDSNRIAVRRSIVSFRGSLIEALVKRGIEVYVLAPDYSLDVKDAVKNLGAQPVDYFLKRTSMNPFLERKALRSLKKVLCAVKPDATLVTCIKEQCTVFLLARL